ncbi:hypothetical protein A2U01_0101287, partial [Trifolium medium]|nr:hypothetical protein [Trifolium medium]
MLAGHRLTSPDGDFLLPYFRQLSPALAGREVMCLACLFDDFEC